jgi:hypothetical protein
MVSQQQRPVSQQQSMVSQPASMKGQPASMGVAHKGRGVNPSSPPVSGEAPARRHNLSTGLNLLNILTNTGSNH